MKRDSLIYMCFIAMLVLMVTMVTPSMSFANDDSAVDDFCSEQDESGENDAILLAKIVPCVESVILKNTLYFNQQMGDIIFPIVAPFLTLMVALYAISILRGEGELTKKGFIFLLKVAFVLAFVREVGGFIPDLFAILSQLQEIVTNGLQSFTEGENCPDMSEYGSAAGEVSPVWVHMDCVLGKLFGFGDEVILGSSIFGIMGAALGSGTLGVQIFFMGILGLASMIFLVIRAVYTYLIAYMYIAFMIIISPMFIPLLAGSGQIFQVFDRYIKGVISAFFIPVFLFGYVVIAMNIIDAVIFADDAPDGLNMSKTFEELIDENEDEYMGHTPQSCDNNVYKDSSFSEDVGEAETPEWLKKIGENVLTTFFSGGVNLCQLHHAKITLEPAKQRDLVFDFMKIAFIIYLLVQVMEVIINIAQQALLGGYALGQAAERKNIIESSVGGSIQGAQRQAMSDVGERGFPGAVAGSVSGAFSGGLSGFRSSIGN